MITGKYPCLLLPWLFSAAFPTAKKTRRKRTFTAAACSPLCSLLLYLIAFLHQKNFCVILSIGEVFYSVIIREILARRFGTLNYSIVILTLI